MDGFVGEIRLFTNNFVPQGWLPCDGSIYTVAQYQVLYAVVGNQYGGDSKNFAVPDLCGRVPMGSGQGPTLTNRNMSKIYGSPTQTLNIQQIPSHTHDVKAKTKNPMKTNTNDPTGNIWVKSSGNIYGSMANVAMAPQAVSNSVGGNKGHANIQPCIAINYFICVEGIYPVKP